MDDCIALFRLEEKANVSYAVGQKAQAKWLAKDSLVISLGFTWNTYSGQLYSYIYPLDEYIIGSNILNFKNKQAYCISRNLTEKYLSLVCPQKVEALDFKDNNKIAEIELIDGKTIITSFIKPEQLQKPIKFSYSTGSTATTQYAPINWGGIFDDPR